MSINSYTTYQDSDHVDIIPNFGYINFTNAPINK